MSPIQDLKKLFCVPSDKKVSLNTYDAGDTAGYRDEPVAKKALEEGIERMAKLQDRLYADNRSALLIIFQAMDAAGKDSTIKHVMSGLNPQGTQVFSYKAPSTEELDHDYLWRHVVDLPERGRIGIFNRSHYEEVLTVRVHPEFLQKQQLPPETLEGDLWKRRYAQINNWEKHLVENGTHILKFFLYVSKDEQKQRFLERIEKPEKNWKFSSFDVNERALWGKYMEAFEDMLNETSTGWAPWYIIPADHKWFTRLAVASIIVDKLEDIDPHYPELSEVQKADLIKSKELLEKET